MGRIFPVEAILPELKAALAENRPVVLSAPPGSGKTTAVPPALIDSPWLAGKAILMLEPRRLAARRAAQFMAALRGERVGETIGYQVRLERKIGPDTRIEILTEGLLTQRLLADPELNGVGLVIFDEFHERSIHADTGLALLLDARAALRPDLRLILMSATLSEAPLAAHLGPKTACITSPARMHPVTTLYLPPAPRTPLPAQMAAAIRQALAEEPGGILAFLPGEGEIRRTEALLRACALPPETSVHPLYAALDSREQDAAVEPPAAGCRKVVLATSIAESALTIEGIRVVIDSGWMRVPRYSSRNGLTRLETLRLSKDRADQRRGRAGRTQPGTCRRLWDTTTEASMPDQAIPEILESDLTGLVLICAEWGVTRRMALPWLTPPREAAWQQACDALTALGALDSDSRITAHGRAMIRLPLHPPLAHLILTLRQRDPYGGPFLAATLTELQGESTFRGETDLRTIIDHTLRADSPFARRIHRLAERWARTSDRSPRLSPEALCETLCEAFPGHIARRRGNSGNRYLSAAGFGAVLPEDSPLLSSDWLILAHVSDDDAEARIRVAAPLSENCIADYADRHATWVDTVTWDRQNDQLIAARRLRLGEITLKEVPLADPPEALIRTALLEAIRRKGIDRLSWSRAETLRNRLQCAHEHLPEEGWPAVEEHLEAWLGPRLAQCRRWAHIEQIDLASALNDWLELHPDPRLPACGLRRKRLDQLLPTHITVPSGSNIPIRYDQPHPYLPVRIQEVFGLPRTPTLCEGRLPVILHLLSPAQRPIQITKDLESFWKNGYTEARKELRGRYPKHDWPENPADGIASRRIRKSPPK